jgi:cold-inducible RNA-binding protein
MPIKLHVGNLNYTTKAETLKAMFSEGGRTVESISMATSHKTGDPRGFAFVHMATDADAQAAIAALDQREIDGRAIKVSESRGRLRTKR